MTVQWGWAESKNRPRAAPQLTSPIRPICWVHVGVHQNWAPAPRIHGITPRTPAAELHYPPFAGARSKPLEPMYPVVFFDALRVKIKEDAVVRSKAIYLALGVQRDGDQCGGR